MHIGQNKAYNQLCTEWDESMKQEESVIHVVAMEIGWNGAYVKP